MNCTSLYRNFGVPLAIGQGWTETSAPAAVAALHMVIAGISLDARVGGTVTMPARVGGTPELGG